MDESVQKSLERYDVLDRIAVGGMAEVFLAKAYGAHGFEKTLAIKRILPELARDPEFEARFIAEAKVAVRLSHANVVQVFDFGRIGESLFIAMEFVDGLDLAALLRKFKDEGRLVPLPAAFHIAIEIMRALDFAHQHNVVHRDVSPSNILISRAGEVKIGDFGIAVAASPHKASGPGPRKVMGKWRYMSPEQTRGDTLDTRSDLFSAASVMFELFTGEKLFPGEESEQIIKNIETMPIPRAAALRSGLPSRLDEILAGPLSRKPIDRPTRPATVLRSLIELSYESSIMATALDVAEAVAAVLPAKRISGAAQLDDVIRKQLGDAKDKSVARKTAVTDGKPTATGTERKEGTTGLFRKADVDGISRLEEVEVDPTAVAAPRARRLSEAPMPDASSPDSGLHKLLDAHLDADRRTEVGGPPTGTVPKSEPEAVADADKKSITSTKSVTADVAGRRSRAPIAIAALVLVAGGGIAAWRLSRKDAAVVTPPPVAADAHVDEAAMGTLEIDPDVEGATGTITGEDGIAHPFGPTSHAKKVRLRVTANKELEVHIEAPGYQPLDRSVHVDPNVVYGMAPTLARARASLHVVTTPAGAQVNLAGRFVGETPLMVADLDAAPAADLLITHAGYEPLKLKVDLAVGKQVDVTQTLKELPKLGSVQINVKGRATWAEVFFKGKDLGRTRTLANVTTFHLPIGKQQIRLENNPAKAKPKTITIDVTGGAQRIDASLE
jgi:tRNA A-37 threonylcarbamoyl transferase component Bud32